MRAIPIDRFLESDDSFPSAGQVYDWKRLVSEGKAARKAADGGSWRIGDLASMVERRYRSGALKRFAEEIGESVGSVRRFRWVAECYDATARRRFPDLSFSHFQAVARLDDRLTWLERARHGLWSVDRLVHESRAPHTPGPDVRLRRPIESASKQIARLLEADERELAKAARAGLTDAVDELAVHVEQLRMRLRAAARRRNLKLAKR